MKTKKDVHSVVTVTENFEIQLPEQMRIALNIKAGQQVTLQSTGDTLRIVPNDTLLSLRASLPGITPFRRDKDDRF